MTKIIPHLWFDNQAKEAASFYCNIFDNSKINNTAPYMVDTPSNKPVGSVMTVEFELESQSFIALNGGPEFKINPSISFLVYCETTDKIDYLWKKLGEKGKTLMPLNKYPFNDYFGWTEDKYGVSWQLLLAEEEEIDQVIVPKIMYVGEANGRTEEAIELYTSVFDNSKIDQITRFGDSPAGESDHISQVLFWLKDQKFAAMDGGTQHQFFFNEAISFLIRCEDQEEIDYFWEKLAEDPSGGQCGWQKDKFGVSWQIVPENIGAILNTGNKEKAEKAMKAFLDMKKIDMQKLEDIISS